MVKQLPSEKMDSNHLSTFEYYNERLKKKKKKEKEKNETYIGEKSEREVFAGCAHLRAVGRAEFPPYEMANCIHGASGNFGNKTRK